MPLVIAAPLLQAIAIFVPPLRLSSALRRFEPASQWDADDVGFVVTCRDLPEVATRGDDMAEGDGDGGRCARHRALGAQAAGRLPRLSAARAGEVVV